MDPTGRFGRGRARGTAAPPEENLTQFYQRRGVGARYPAPLRLPAPGVPEDDVPDPDVAGRMRYRSAEAVDEEAGESPEGSKNGSNGNGNGDNGNGSNGDDESTNGSGNGNGKNGSDDSNGSDDGSKTPPTPESSSTEEDKEAKDKEGKDDDDEGERGRGRKEGRGMRPDILDYVQSRPEGLVDKEGKTGSPINLIANYFQLQHKKSWMWKQHRVDVKPEEDSARIRKELVSQQKETLPVYIFDGTLLMTYEPLEPEPRILNCERNGVNYVVEIRHIRDFATGDAFTSQFHNLIVRKTLQALKLDLLGRHYYDGQARIELPNWRLELWPGFITSMRKCEIDVLLNVEVTHKMIRTDNVFYIMEQMKREAQDMQAMRAKIEQMLVGRIVMTRYNNKTYRIDSIDWDSRANGTFEITRKNEEPRQISFREYYMTRYNVQLQNPNQPLLISLPKQRALHNQMKEAGPISLIPELCYITGLDEDQRANFSLMKDMSQHLHMKPDRRVGVLKNFMRRIRDTPEIVDDMAKWGVRFNTDLVPLKGRVLPSELLIFGGEQGQNFKADWSMAFRSNQLHSTPKLTTWVFIVPSRAERGVDNLIQTMQRVSRPINYIMSPPDLVRIAQDRPGAYCQAIGEALRKHQDKLQMLFFVLPNPKIELYATIKKEVSIRYGIPSQCFLAKNVNSKGLMSIATKLVIQMCAKQGGEPWCVSNPLKNLMVVGYDVYHSAGKSGKSVGAMVATLSHTMARYFSTVSYFSNRDELSENMGVDIQKCITAYKSVNKVLPARIMFYRDGVGEGQLKQVYESELEQMKAILKTMYTDDGMELPKFTFVVVNKRINTRFFHDTHATYENPPPGTVVDTVVTLPERYDFFLISQLARQGTVSPCSYNVLYDDSLLPADRLQIFTFKLCHLYFNWSGTVAVPAPCQYAHKLAYLTGLALGNSAHSRLQYLLHYL